MDGKKKRDIVSRIAATHAKGVIASGEIHGTEIPGPLSAGTDAARETAILLVFFSLFFPHLSHSQMFLSFAILSFGWLIWKAGRGAWLGWSRLERLHRILEEEKWEIEHDREKEREELKSLYTAKGFHGKLLEDVVDVLMADGDRLLRVMIEEELGLSLEVHEHPLKQSFGAALGVLSGSLLCFLGYFLWPSLGLPFILIFILGISAGWSAYYQKNRMIPAIVWNIGIGILSIGTVFFLFQYFKDLRWL